jgi:hypothetical protein
MHPDLTLMEAAMRLGVSYNQALRRLLIGELEGGRRDGKWHVTSQSVERWLAATGKSPGRKGLSSRRKRKKSDSNLL